MIKHINEKHKDYHQHYAITKSYLKKLRKVLKGIKNTHPEISQVVITQFDDGELHITVAHRKE